MENTRELKCLRCGVVETLELVRPPGKPEGVYQGVHDCKAARGEPLQRRDDPTLDVELPAPEQRVRREG